jgi:hypothetical protein
MMSNDRLSPLDASFLYLETSAEPIHIGAVALRGQYALELNREARHRGSCWEVM